MRIGAFVPYPATGPSTRFRVAQFMEPLGRRGIDVVLLPFMAEDEYRDLYAGSVARRAAILARGLGRRRREIAAADADAWLVHRELAPLGTRALLARLRLTGLPMVFDFDDAIYLPPRGGHPILRPFRRPHATTAALARHATLVLAGNRELADFARGCRPGREEGVHRLPTVIDADRFRPASGRAATDPPVLGWIGTHTTASYLQTLLPALTQLRERRAFQLRVVSNRQPDWLAASELDWRFEPWSAQREVEQTRALTVGLYPLEDTAWERGKCGFKAIQYMACGVPVVASAVGVLDEVVLDGRTGVLVRDPEDWVQALDALLGDPERLAHMGEAGRAHVERSYSVDSVVDELAGHLAAAAGSESRAARARSGSQDRPGA